MRGLEHVLQPGEIGLDEARVALEVLRAHTGQTARLNTTSQPSPFGTTRIGL
jgi:hypothetical protein